MSARPLRRLSLATLCLALAAPAARSQDADRPGPFHRAYYLHHERGDLEAALPLYRAAAADQATDPAIRGDAARFAAELEEELASRDFARLAPADTVLYLELNRPGQQLRSLIEQLGLELDGREFGISPRLVEGLLGVRGIAVAVTEIDPRQGPTNGVLIVHPGDHALLRGLIETALPLGGVPTEPIGGHPTWRIEGRVLVTATDRLLLVGLDPAQIAGVVGRLAESADGGLAGRPELASAMAMRGDDLLFFCAHLEPLMPMLTEALQRETRHDPEARAMLAFLDLPSTRYLAGRAGVSAEGLSLDFGVELDEGHRNLAFHLLRLPALDGEALEMVPAGAAAFAAMGVNHRGSLPAGTTDGEGRPAVTLLDFGREIFANVADAALFVLPSAQRSPVGPIPDAALALRVNDPARSRALWRLVLGTAQTASGGGQEVPAVERDGVTIDRYTIQGLPIFVAVDGEHLLVSPSEAAVSRAIEARRSGQTLRGDPVFRTALETLGEDCTQLIAFNVGRCGALAMPFLGERERREAEPVLAMLGATSLGLRVEHGSRRLAVHGRVLGMPDLGPMVEQLIEQRMQGARRVEVAAASARPAGVVRANSFAAGTAAGSASVADAMATFAKLHATGDRAAAARAAQNVAQLAAQDARRLNDFAWALLTDPEYDNGYDGIAREMSRRSNELGGWSDWYHLDTYAHALFLQGRIDEAIELERKAIALGGDDPRIGEARAALDRFLAAKR
jgi:tetratricopeptide (TPR) repeat protein